MYLDGRTQGKPWHAPPVDTNNPALERAWQRVKSTGSWANCTSADRMRLRRVPKWLWVFSKDAGLVDLEIAYAKWRLVRRLAKHTIAPQRPQTP